jgi:Family of unknown function (DUF6499)/Uncharacterized conserved protein (DUF2285)
MTAATKWGVPEWRDIAAYPHPKGRDRMLRWAWEFLRRNPEYRKRWENMASKFIDNEGYALDGSLPVIKEFAERFGLVAPLIPSNPASKEPPWFKASMVRELRPPSVALKLKPTELGYVFDLTMPLEGQFARALWQAKSVQKGWVDRGRVQFRNTRTRADKYITYLRIIDAEDSGCSPREIRDKLFANMDNEHPTFHRKEAFRDHRTAAMRLRDSDYRLLAAMVVRPGTIK